MTDGVRVTQTTYGYGNKAPHDAMLASGVCTHDEVRSVLGAALTDPGTHAAIRDYFTLTAKAVIVDEVFDGNVVDLKIVALAADAGIPTTIIGDPWQALYDFRGARPELVPQIIGKLEFTTFPVSESFRFETKQMLDLTDRLRRGQAVTVDPGSAHDTDVVLATHWDPLWTAADNVLPLSFGQIGNRIDAAIGLLLERVVTSHFGELVTVGPEAALILGLDPELIRCEASTVFAPVLERLHGGHPNDATAALELLRAALLDLGSERIPKLQEANETERAARMALLGQRLTQSKGELVVTSGDVVPVGLVWGDPPVR